MALNGEKKQELVQKFGKNKNDTGTPEVQIALITEQMAQISSHLEQHKHDFHSQRGLMKLIGKRRRLLRFLQLQNLDRYRQIIQELGIRK